MHKIKMFWSLIFIICGIMEALSVVYFVVECIRNNVPWYDYLMISIPTLICIGWWIVTIYYIKNKDM